MNGKHASWALCLLALVTVFFASVIASAGAAGREPFVGSDAWGDANGAPDIKLVTVSDAHGVVSLSVRVAGLETGEGVDAAFLDTGIDIDRNVATGDVLGIDYAFEVYADAGGLVAILWQYADGGWTEISPSDAVSVTRVGETYTFAFATSELGGNSGFDLHVSTGAWSLPAGLIASDFAPGDGSWTYWPVTTEDWDGGGAVAALPDGSLYLAGDDSLWHRIDPATLQALGLSDAQTTYYDELPGARGDPVTPVAVATPTPVPALVPPPQAAPAVVIPVIARPTTTPASPVAGRVFTLRFAVTQSDTGLKLREGKMICDPSVQGKVIKHFEQFKNGTATMRFTIPKAYKGKLMKVHLTIASGGQSATRNLVFHVG